MLGEVKIGDKTIEMKATGSTPFWYNQVFHVSRLEDDFFNATQTMEDNPGAAVGVWSRVAFIMMKQAEGKIDKANESQFMKWLDEFEAMEIPNAIPAIVDIYMAQTSGAAKAKK